MLHTRLAAHLPCFHGRRKHRIQTTYFYYVQQNAARIVSVLFQQNVSEPGCKSTHDLQHFLLVAHLLFLVFAALARCNYKKSGVPKLWPIWMVFLLEEAVRLRCRNHLQWHELHSHRSLLLGYILTHAELPLGNVSFASGNCVTRRNNFKNVAEYAGKLLNILQQRIDA